MKYKNISEGIFIDRPNRFIANVLINGKKEVCHVKNTGRCRELLKEGVRVFAERSENPLRKTKYDLVAVYKGDVLFNIDSQAPNKVFGEWARESGYFGDEPYIKAECKYKASRFDFYIENGDERIFVEVKGVTLEKNGVLLFPDAPTERGVKHINEMCEAVEEGFTGIICFVVQTEYAEYFTPNKETHPQFAEALKRAEEKGVRILCLNCYTEPEQLRIKDVVPIRIL